MGERRRTVLWRKISKEHLNKHKKTPKKSNSLTYLVEKILWRWERGGEQFYDENSAKNTPKSTKKTKKNRN
jgi:hypothetical protein